MIPPPSRFNFRLATFVVAAILVSTMVWTSVLQGSSPKIFGFKKRPSVSGSAPIQPLSAGPEDLLAADFESDPCNLGGAVGVYGAGEPDWNNKSDPQSWTYEKTTPGYEKENVHSGDKSFRLVNGTGLNKDLAWASLGINLGPVTDKACTPVRVRPVDVSGYRALTFWVKGEKGGERIEVLFRDAAARSYIPQYRFRTGALKPGWQKVLIPLKELEGKVDLAGLVHVGIGFGMDLGNPRGTTVYVDDFAFTSTE